MGVSVLGQAQNEGKRDVAHRTASAGWLESKDEF